MPTLTKEFLRPKKPLPDEWDIVDYDWKFRPKEDLDLGDKRRGRLPCPYTLDETRQADHRTNCKCFVNNLHRVEGWRENMEDSNSDDEY